MCLIHAIYLKEGIPPYKGVDSTVIKKKSFLSNEVFFHPLSKCHPFDGFIKIIILFATLIILNIDHLTIRYLFSIDIDHCQ